MIREGKAESYAEVINQVMPRLLALVDKETQIGTFSMQSVLSWRSVKEEFKVNNATLVQLMRGLGLLKNKGRFGSRGCHWWVKADYRPVTTAQVIACSASLMGCTDENISPEMQLAALKKRRTEMTRSLRQVNAAIAGLESA